MVVKDPLTFRQRAFVDEYLMNGGNATKAAEKAYNVTTYGSARAVGSEVLSSPNVALEVDKKRRSMREIFDEKGMTDAAVADILLDGAKNAKKYFIKGDKLASVDDYGERRQYTKLISDMKELFPDSSIKVDAGDGSNIQINVISGKGYNARKEADNISRPTVIDATPEGSIVE